MQNIPAASIEEGAQMIKSTTYVEIGYVNAHAAAKAGRSLSLFVEF